MNDLGTKKQTIDSAELRKLAKELPFREFDEHEVDQLAERVQGGLIAQRSRRHRAAHRGWIAAAAIVLIAFVVGFLIWQPNLSENTMPPLDQVAQTEESDSSPPPEQQIEDDRILAEDGTNYEIRGSRQDRIVRLRHGKVTCDVDRRAKIERFRVVVGDAEVEVRGTRFRVVAKHDRLESVHVERGRVEVRPDQGEFVALLAGQSWPQAVAKVVHEPDAAPTTPKVSRRRRTAPLKTHTAHPEPGPQPGEHLRAGMDLLDRGDFGSAVDQFRQEAELGTLRQDALFWEAVALKRASRDADARRVMTTYLSRYPNGNRSAEVHCMLGWLLVDSGQTSRARSHFENASRSDVARTANCGRRGLSALSGD